MMMMMCACVHVCVSGWGALNFLFGGSGSGDSRVISAYDDAPSDWGCLGGISFRDRVCAIDRAVCFDWPTELMAIIMCHQCVRM